MTNDSPQKYLYAWFLICVLSLPSLAFAGTPSGAVKLAKAKLSKKSGFYCGNTKGSTWVPGKLLSNGYFYPHQAEKNNLTKDLKKASKAKQKKIQSQIDSLTDLISSRSPLCSTTPTPTPTP